MTELCCLNLEKRVLQIKKCISSTSLISFWKTKMWVLEIIRGNNRYNISKIKGATFFGLEWIRVEFGHSILLAPDHCHWHKVVLAKELISCHVSYVSDSNYLHRINIHLPWGNYIPGHQLASRRRLMVDGTNNDRTTNVSKRTLNTM